MQIFGAGMAGCYLAKLCEKEGIDYRIYDIRKRPNCNCAWGLTDWVKFNRLLSEIGYNAYEYLLSKTKKLESNIVSTNYRLYTFDRSKLLSDMWSEINVRKPEEKTDKVLVDATGSKRALLPPIKNDVLIPCYQIRCKTNLDKETVYIYFSKDMKGYAWAFPIGEEWHIGAGHMDGKDESKRLLGRMIEYFDIKFDRVICKCLGYVRHLAPSKCKPMYFYDGKHDIFGVGESIGLVTVLGAGNLLALESAKELIKIIQNEDSYNDYEKVVLDKFYWVEKEYKFIENVRNRKIIDTILSAKDLIGMARLTYAVPLIKVLVKYVRKREIIDDGGE